MPSYEILNVSENGMEVRWNDELTLNHEIPIVLRTANPPAAAVDLAIQEMYPYDYFQKRAELRPDVDAVRTKYIGRKGTFTTPLDNPVQSIIPQQGQV